MIVRRTAWNDERVRAWWNAAYRSGRLYRDTFFQRYEWNALWDRHFVASHSRRESMLLCVERDGAIIAVAPMYVQQRALAGMRAWRSLHWIAERLAQYPDLVTTEADPRPVWDALLQWLDEQFPDAWLELRDILPESSCAHVHGPGDEEGEHYCALSLAGLTRERLLSRVDDHMRRELRRAFRRLDEMEQLRWTFQQEADIELLHQLITLNRSRFGAASYFADEANSAFFLDVATAARDEIWTATLREGEAIIAMLMGYRHADALLYVLSGLDDTRKALSPGTTVLGATVLHAAEAGLATFDFLRGEERYKFEFAPDVRRSRHCTVLFRDAALRHRAANVSRRALDRVRRTR